MTRLALPSSLMLLVALVLVGCANAPRERVEVIRKATPTKEQVVIVPAPKIEGVGPYASKFALMAIFAKVVYRKDLPMKTRDELECAYLSAGTPLPSVGMPAGSGWSRWRGPNREGCLFKDGLALEVYVHTGAAGTFDEAAIVYRGTENFNFKAAMSDWWSNVAGPLGIESPQYRLAQAHLDAAIPALLALNKDIRIYAVGHSLGGGLAQQAGYYSVNIKEVFAFDPSPVTNWTHLKDRNKIANEDPTIYRVYHQDEALAYVRNITTRFNSRRFGRQDFEFFFQDWPKEMEKALGAHEMGILACHLAASIPGTDAEHGLTKKAALDLLNKSYRTPPNLPEYEVHPICPPGVTLPASLWDATAVVQAGGQ